MDGVFDRITGEVFLISGDVRRGVGILYLSYLYHYNTVVVVVVVDVGVWLSLRRRPNRAFAGSLLINLLNEHWRRERNGSFKSGKRVHQIEIILFEVERTSEEKLETAFYWIRKRNKKNRKRNNNFILIFIYCYIWPCFNNYL